MHSLIAIDCRFAASRSGLGRYTRELVRHLVTQPSDLRFVLLVRGKNEDWIPAKSDSFSVLETDIPHYSLAEQLQLPRIIKNTNVDLLFSPHFNVPYYCPVPFVVTIHDLILHRFPNASPLHRRLAYRALMHRAIGKAERVITISHFVAEEVKNAYTRNADVIYEGVDPMYAQSTESESERVRNKYELSLRYFLYVGNAKQHKNVQTLIRAFQKLDTTKKELVLVTGGKELEKLLPLPAGVKVLRDVPDADLPALYGASEAFVTASLYEGFCLPVAEALACGCSVIASNKTAIPEIASGRAVLVEPTVDAFAAAMKFPLMRPKPFVIASWEQCAKQTLAILKESVHEKTPPPKKRGS